MKQECINLMTAMSKENTADPSRSSAFGNFFLLVNQREK